MKADDTGHHLTQKYKDKDTDKDKYKDKDKDKAQIGPNMCYIFEEPSTYQTIYFVKADDTGHHLTQKYKDKDTDKDKDKYTEKDKRKVNKRPYMCHTFGKQMAQEYQL